MRYALVVRSLWITSLAALAWTVPSSVALAEVSRTATIAAEPVVDAPAIATSTATAARPLEPRTRPEDARGWQEPPGIDFEDALLFVPRLVLSPVRLVLTAVFFPIEKGLRLAEEHHLMEEVIDLVYNDARTAALLPFITGVSSDGPTLGVVAFHRDLFGHGEGANLSARYGGLYSQAYDLGFEGDQVFGTPLWIEARLRHEVKPRLLYRGIGGSDASPDSRFRETRTLGMLRLGTSVGPVDRRLKIGATGVFNRRRFGSAVAPAAGDVSIESVYATSEIEGFDEGSDIFEVSGDLVIDLRDRPTHTSSGLYFEGFVGGAPPQGGPYQFLHWGAEASYHFDLHRGTRVLALRAAVEAIDAEEGRAPFSELPRIGGAARLRGYRVDSFRDEKVMIGTVEYRYPIHQHVTGELFVDVGRVAKDYDLFFERHPEGAWKVGVGGGFIVSGDSPILKIDFSYGDRFLVLISTEPFMAFEGRAARL